MSCVKLMVGTRGSTQGEKTGNSPFCEEHSRTGAGIMQWPRLIYQSFVTGEGFYDVPLFTLRERQSRTLSLRNPRGFHGLVLRRFGYR